MKLLRVHRREAFAVALMFCASVVFSQESANDVLEQSRAYGSAALQHLRDGEIDQALGALGNVADLSFSAHPSHDDGLSAAAGALHRELTQLSADERFDLLYKWSMPTDSRKGVRLLTTVVPQSAPPKAFARVLGERPRDQSFSISAIGPIRGLFSTGWSLVQAADETGRLSRLTTELEQLTADEVPNADVLLLLARLANNRIDTSVLIESLERRASSKHDLIHKPDEQAEAQVPAGLDTDVIDPTDIVLTAAALTHETLRPTSERMFNSLVELTYGRPATRLRPFLRLAHATAVKFARGESELNLLHNSRPKYWVPMSGRTSALHAQGAVDAVWVVHEDHILHLAGARNDVLFLRYPLTGEFEFTCEAQEGGRIETDGGLVYGGLQFEAQGATNLLRVWDADIIHSIAKPCPFVRHERRPTFNRVSIRSSVDGAEILSNRHPVWLDDEAAARQSPWFGLRSFDDRRPLFRNLRITGNPVIPRQVRMSGGDHLRGWQSHFFGETQAAFAAGSTASPVSPHIDWSVQAGVISAAKSERSQSLLRYQRPLLDGESVTYEFYYEQGEFEVNPAVGRLAFLIQPGGVRVHWITDGSQEWTGLPEDNVLLEPLNRRGPRPLPLQDNDWNTVTLARRDDKLTVSLNDTTIYERPIDFAGDHLFGLYLDRTKSAAKARNVVMTGDWPETLPSHFIDNPAAVTDSERTKADRRGLGRIFNDLHTAAAALTVHQRAAAMSLEERYAYLSNWVLPSDDHATLRLTIDFTPANPAKPGSIAHPIDVERLNKAGVSGDSRVLIGGHLVSPAIDLIEAAAQLGYLDDVRERIEKAHANGDLQQRSQLALLALVDMARQDFDASLESLKQLSSREYTDSRQEFVPRWPETLAIWQGIRHRQTRDSLRELLISILQREVRSGGGRSGWEAWDRQIAALPGQLRKLESQEEKAETNARDPATPNLHNWSPVSRATARSRGQGMPSADWQLSRDYVENLAGHNDDYLYYRVPLRGNFEVECDVTSFDFRDSHLSVAGTWVAPKYDLKSYAIGDFRQRLRLGVLSPPMSPVDRWIRYRAVVLDGVCATWCNGRLLHEQPLAAAHDPWIAVRSPWIATGAAREVRITGEPNIPTEIAMASLAGLSGWISYYDRSIGHGGAEWTHVAGLRGIFGRLRPELKGSGLERLLHYHRPMLEDGTIEFEFFYREGETHTHPALDRLVFLLDPRGVRIHWATDGVFDRTGADPLNVVEEPANRRGPDRLPLKPDDWNRLQLKLTGDTVDLILNDELVYRRKVEPDNQRAFGLFHYADQTEVRVRDVVWRGGWPRVLPAVENQELAKAPTDDIDEGLARLTAHVHHDFAIDGLPTDRFVVHVHGGGDDWRRHVAVKPDGLHVSRPGVKGYSSYWLAARMQVHGDFDITAAFDKLSVKQSEHGSGGLSLTAILENVGYTHGTAYRGVLIDPVDPIRHITQSEFIRSPNGQTRMNWIGTTSEEATSGRLRLARRGDTLHCLFAENDSLQYRLVHTEKVGKERLLMEGVRLTAAVQASGDKPGTTSVVWKDLTVRAERITGWPAQNKRNAP